MKNRYLIAATLSFLIFTACKKDKQPQDDNRVRQLNDKFDTSPKGWTVDYADYVLNPEHPDEFEHGINYLPPPLNGNNTGLKISGKNQSDDLFMFMKKKLTGLKPNQRYKVDFEVNFASNAPSNGIGSGGSPGEGVSLGVGFSITEPKKVVQGNYYRMNISKINQTEDGDDMVVIGNISNGTDVAEYKLLKKTGSFTGKTDEKGEVWVIIGTDSGYEWITTLYYTSVKVVFNKVN